MLPSAPDVTSQNPVSPGGLENHLKRQIAELKSQIADAQREANERDRAVPLPNGLLTLSSQILFSGDTAPLLQLGKNIFGISERVNEAKEIADRATQAYPVPQRDVAVQTDPAVQEAAEQEKRAREAELLKLKFQKKQYDLQIATCSAELEKLHEEVGGRTSRRGSIEGGV
mmetsp:Transcript_38600/g.61026  ORF Transcript_38600/g.61026 Transcript_38600/m.61026 type:complete len:171 (+) Transcript_38600:932-1444(+)